MPKYKNNSQIKTYGRYDFVIKPNEEKESYIFLETNDELIMVDEKPYYTPVIYDEIYDKSIFVNDFTSNSDGRLYKYIEIDIPYYLFDECYIKISPIFISYDDVKSIYKALKVKFNGLDTQSMSFYEDFVIDRYIPVFKRIYILLDNEYYNKVDFLINISVFDVKFGKIIKK